MDKYKIISIDDNASNLGAFKALFRRDYEVYTSTSPSEALELIGEKGIQVVVCDYKMPEMSGVELLGLVRERFPDTVRILLSGHADINAAMEAINKGEVFRFIKKPWVESLLVNEIMNAVELHRARRELLVKNQELEKATEEMSKLIYSAAHDLTSPLATVLGLINLAKSYPEEMPVYMDYIEETTQKLDDYTRNLLHFHRNKLSEVQREKIDLNAFFQSLLERYKFYPGFADFETEISVKGSVSFYSDPTRLNIIFSNLMANSIKYKDPKKEFSLIKMETQVTEDAAEILFCDNGLGIAEDKLPKVFDMFYRVSSDSTGSGIGLYLVKEAIQRLNGSIHIKSQFGKGTEFFIRLPQVVETVKNGSEIE